MFGSVLYSFECPSGTFDSNDHDMFNVQKITRRFCTLRFTRNISIFKTNISNKNATTLFLVRYYF